MMYDILHDLRIDESPNKIFSAITEPLHLNNWWTKECSGQAKLGETYRLYFSPEYDWQAEVSICQPAKQFELTMTKSDADWANTRFGFELSPLEGGVCLSHYHTGWQSTNPHFRRSSYSWAQLLRLLKNYVEKEEVVPFEHRA